MIEVENLKKTFRKKVVLNEIGFKTQGRIVGLLGPNGSGKTTFLKTVAGFLPGVDGDCTLGNNIIIGYFDQYSAAIQ